MVETEYAEEQIKTQVVLEVDFPVGILRAVEEGEGLTILPELYARLGLAGSGLWMIDLCDPVPHHSVRLSYRGNRYQDIAAREFGTLSRTTMTRLLAGPKHSHRSTVTTG